MNDTVTSPEATGSRILVGVDDSRASLAALRWASEYAELIGARVEVVHVWTSDSPFVFVNPAVFVESAVEAAHQSLDAFMAQAYPEGPPPFVTSRIVRGDPARTLEKLGSGARMIVVGTRPHSELAGMLLGSVAQHVATHATAPVVVIPATYLERGAGTDRSEASRNDRHATPV